MRKKVRTLRHWKQRFDKNAEFIWRRPITWQGKTVKAGDPTPQDLQDNKTKLRRFWEARVIELAEFEEPNVLTGQKQEPATFDYMAEWPGTPENVEVQALAMQQAGHDQEAWDALSDMERANLMQIALGDMQTLLGSDVLASELDIHGEMIPLGEVVELAYMESGISVPEWNALEDEDREARLQSVVDMMLDLGDDDEVEEPEVPSIADKEPADLVTKETDRKWHVEGVEEVFKSKTLATAKAAEMIAEAKAAEAAEDDAWLDGDNQED